VTHRAAFLTLALALLLPVAASAQFTTFVSPPQRADSVKAVIVAEQRAQADSAARMTLTNMRAWVDSAAGVASPVTDTVGNVATNEPAATQPSSPTTSFSEGALAPDTATALPLLALLGLASLSLGIVLLAGRKRA
jgi:hypothetical protein